MTTGKRRQIVKPTIIGNLPLPQGDTSGTRYLIGAVLVAGKDGCQCEACQLLKKFGGELGAALLKEEEIGGD